MNVLDAARDLKLAAEEVLESSRRYSAAVTHATACLHVATKLRDQVPVTKRKWFDEQIKSLGTALGLLK